MKKEIIINLDELSLQNKNNLLTALYNIEDNEMYKCESVSKAINDLQNELFKKDEEEQKEETKKSTRYFLELEYFDKNHKCFISYEAGCYDDKIFDSFEEMIEYAKKSLNYLEDYESLAYFEETTEDEKWAESEIEYLGSILKNENIYNEE